MLDTGATHCFVCAQLVDMLGLLPGSTPGPNVVSMASPDLTRPLAQPVSVSLALGTTAAIREVIDMSPLDLGAGLDVILGWDWISSHDLRFLYPQGSITGVAGSNTLELPLQPSPGASPTAAQTQLLLAHGEFRRMLRHVTHDPPTLPYSGPGSNP